MRILVTGFSGFVGSHFLEHLAVRDVDAEVVGISRTALPSHDGLPPHVRFRQSAVNMLDKAAIGEVLSSFRPTHVLHLAAYSSVGFSWQHPVESFTNNTNIFLNLLDQVRSLELDCRVLSVGSSEEYGPVRSEMLPLREDAALNPISPYAVARVAQELLSNVYVRGFGLDLIMTRSFNHIGARQREQFVVPSLAKQFVSMRASGQGRLTTGDREIVRDFVDVRDVVRAYFELLTRGTSGQIYNVCSGRGVSIDSVIARMQAQLGTNIELHTDPALVRPAENPVVIGSYEKLERELGWRPQIDLDESLRWILDWWQERLRDEAR
jgi:GDP-4-dehydro-6-deoxy-D-mannose reductase